MSSDLLVPPHRGGRAVESTPVRFVEPAAVRGYRPRADLPSGPEVDRPGVGPEARGGTAREGNRGGPGRKGRLQGPSGTSPGGDDRADGPRAGSVHGGRCEVQRGARTPAVGTGTRVTGLADDDIALRTDEVVRRSMEVVVAATEQADELDKTIETLREMLWGGA